MSLLFADIYDGIRCLRIQKGVCERDILNYVQDKVGGCMKVGNVLKTIRTIKKLVDDGVLIKKGNRYLFSGKSPDEDEEEEEEEEDECDKEDELDMDDDECDEGDDDDDGDEEEDEENDGDDDEEDEEDDEDEGDDDDDDDCDEKEDEDEDCDEKDQAKEGGNGDGEGDGEKCEEDAEAKSKTQFPGSPQPSCTPEQNGNGADTSVPDKATSKDPCLQKAPISRNLTSEKKSGKVTKDTTVMDQESSKGGEAIAFCARDFIDSMRQRSKTEDRIQNSETSEENVEDNMEENMDSEKIIKNSVVYSAKMRKARAKKNFESRRIFRSRSPIKKVKANLFTTMKPDSDEIGYREISSEIFREPIEAEMEVDPDKGETGFESSYRKQSPVGPPLIPLPAGGRLDRQESCCSNIGTDPRDIKLEPCFEEPANPSTVKSSQVKLSVLKKGDYNEMTWYPLEESEKQQEMLKKQEMLKRSLSPDEGRDSDGRHVSLCSVCEKKKRNS